MQEGMKEGREFRSLEVQGKLIALKNEFVPFQIEIVMLGKIETPR